MVVIFVRTFHYEVWCYSRWCLITIGSMLALLLTIQCRVVLTVWQDAPTLEPIDAEKQCIGGTNTLLFLRTAFPFLETNKTPLTLSDNLYWLTLFCPTTLSHTNMQHGKNIEQTESYQMDDSCHLQTFLYRCHDLCTYECQSCPVIRRQICSLTSPLFPSYRTCHTNQKTLKGTFWR